MSQGRLDPRNRRKRLTLEDFDPGALLTVGDVAAIFQVDNKTVVRWENKGRIKCLRLPSGHRRFEYAEVARYRDTAEGDW